MATVVNQELRGTRIIRGVNSIIGLRVRVWKERERERERGTVTSPLEETSQEISQAAVKEFVLAGPLAFHAPRATNLT